MSPCLRSFSTHWWELTSQDRTSPEAGRGHFEGPERKETGPSSRRGPQGGQGVLHSHVLAAVEVVAILADLWGSR